MSFLVIAVLALVPFQETALEDESAAKLAKVKRVYIDILTGGDSALQIRDLLVASLQGSKQFIVTEDDEKADAIMKGAAKDEVFKDVFQSSDGLNVHSQVGGGANGSTRSSGRYLGLTVGETESRRSEERKHEAMATVRLVSKDGDVIWSATAESLGGKFLGASADVADKIAKRLVADYRAAKKRSAEPAKAAQAVPGAQ